MNNKLVKILFLMFLLVSTISFAAKDFDVRNNSNSFLFVNGSTGKVGVGTTAPNQLFTVAGAVNITGATYIGASPCSVGEVLTTNSAGLISCTTDNTGSGGDGTGGWTNTSTTTSTGLNVNLSGKMFVNATSGNVGIGTSSPTQKLDVNGSINATIFYGAGTGLTGTASGLSIGGNAATATSLAADPADCGANTWATTIGSNGALTCSAVTYAGISSMTSANFAGVISDETGSGSLVFNNSPTFGGNINLPSGIWNSSGSVGIGTTAPTRKLDVTNGEGYLLARLYGNAGTGSGLAMGSVGDTQWLIGPGMNDLSNANDFAIGNTGSNKMVIQAAGNVGIGTRSPGYKLEVNGTLNATTFYGAGTGLTGTASGLSIGGNAATVTNGVYTTSAWSGDLSGTGLSPTVNYRSSAAGWTNNSQNTTTTLNVGIGTTSPSKKLEVNGESKFGGNISLSSSDVFKISSNKNLTLDVALLDDSNLVSFWRFENNWNDYLGRKDGSLVGSVLFGDVKYGAASAVFSGSTNNYIQLPSLGLNNNGQPFTIELWYKTNRSDVLQMLVSDGSGAGGDLNEWHLDLRLTNGKFTLDIGKAQVSPEIYFSGNTSIQNNTWYHVAATYDGNGVAKIYLNGNLDNISNTVTIPSATNNDDWVIGGASGSVKGTSPVNGSIDEVKIYNISLNASTISQHYNSRASFLVKNSLTDLLDMSINGNLYINGIMFFANSTSGNVGIGTSSPTQKLDVNGSVNATTYYGAGTGLTGTASGLSIGGNAATVTNGVYTNTVVGLVGNATAVNTTSNIQGLGFNTTSQLDNRYLSLSYNSTLARVGNCPDGQVVQNTTNNGVQCVTVSSSSADGTGGWTNDSTTTSTGLNVNLTTGNLTVMNGAVGIGVDPTGYGSPFIVSKTYPTSAGLNFQVGAGPSGVNIALSDADDEVGSALYVQSSNPSSPAVYISGAGSGTALIVNGGDSIFIGNVGIGVSVPQNKLDVEGGVAIGAAYSGTNTAPTNGLIIEGNVGIGTSSPLSKLSIANTGDNHNFRIVNDAVNTTIYSGNLTGGQVGSSIGTISENQFRIFTNNTDRLTVDTNGNVGIGTASPSTKLDINGTITATGLTSTGTVSLPSTTTISSKNVCLADGTNCAAPSYSSNAAGWANTSSTTSTGLNVNLTTGNLTVGGKIIHQVTISSSPYNVLARDVGKVHYINISSATINLPITGINIGDDFIFVDLTDTQHVIDGATYIQYGTSSSQTFTTADATDGEIYKLYRTNGGWRIIEATDDKYVFNSGFVPYTGAGADIDLGTHGLNVAVLNVLGSSTDNRLYIKAGESQSTYLAGFANNLDQILSVIDVNGNVGIGTATPNTKLDVNGSAYFAGNVGIGTAAPKSKLDVNGNLCIGYTCFVELQKEITPDANTSLLMHLDKQSEYGEDATNVHDFSGNGNDGVVYGGAVWNSSGRLGGAYHFNGVDGYISKLSGVSNIGGTDKLTISSWIKLDSTGEYHCIYSGNYQSAVGSMIFRLNNDNKFLFYMDDVSTNYRMFTSTNTLTDTTSWHHAVATYDAGTILLYVDNVLWSGATTGTWTGNVNAITTYSTIGAADTAGGWAYYFNGSIDDVGVWNKALSASEINQIYQDSKSNFVINNSNNDSVNFGIVGNLGIGTSTPNASLEVNGGIRMNTTTAKPTCGAGQRGTMWYQQNFTGNNEDVLWTCMSNSTSSYNWVMVARGG